MTPEDLFALVGPPTLIGWLILIAAPRRWAALNAVPMWVIPAGLSALYAALVLTHFSGAGGGYGSLADVRQLMSSDWTLLAGWVHYLAFDMMVGAIMARRMDEAGVQRLVQAPVLVTIFMFGPLGFLLGLATTEGLRPFAHWPKGVQNVAV